MRIAVRDTELFFDVEGAEFVADGPVLRRKPTVLVLHGGPGADHSRLKPAFSRLSEVAQVIYIDHRGHGRSARGSSSSWTLANWAEDIREFCRTLEIERPILLGVSFGGFVAIRYATRYSSSLSGLILSSTRAHSNLEHICAAFAGEGGSGAGSVARRFWEGPTPKTLGEYVSVCFPLFGHSPPDRDAARRTIVNPDVLLRFCSEEHNSMDMRRDLAAIDCPTLVLSGPRDPINPLEDVREMVCCIPEHRCTWELFHDQRHNLSKDCPEEYFAVIERWITANIPAAQ